jgi:large subunit ribosomal protein L6
MSRIGKMPVPIPAGVKAKLQDGQIFVEGPKGKLSARVPSVIKCDLEKDQIVFTPTQENQSSRALHGLTRALAANCVKGVTEGFVKRLQVIGVGYRVSVSGSKIEFHLGYSHPIIFDLPKGITANAELDRATKTHILTLEGIDKQLVGQVAADTRVLRKPEPYKGKGIRYLGEHIRLKAGKAGK